jgi:hypothetical protein
MNFEKKQYYRDLIAKYEQSEKTCEDIKKVVAEFSHYKQVNKRFTDALEKLGYYARIYVSHKQILTVSKVWGLESKHNGRVEIGECGKPLTWELILESIERQNFPYWQQYFRDKLAAYDNDIAQLEGLLVHMKGVKLGCFDMYKEIWAIEDIIRNAKHKDNA